MGILDVEKDTEPKYPAENTAEMRAKQLAAGIKTLIAARGYAPTAYRLWKLTGVSERICEDILNGKVAARQQRVLDKLAAGLQVSEAELYDESANETICIGLTPEAMNVLRSVAAVRKTEVKDLARQAVDQLVRELEAEPGIREVMDVISRARELAKASLSQAAGRANSSGQGHPLPQG